MGNSARKKEKHRLKRKEKQLALRKSQNLSMARKLSFGQLLRCSINQNWKRSGLASILILRQLPGGGLAFGGFLVDIFCVGLKDAWARTQDVYAEDYEHALERAGGGDPMVPCDPDLARRLVAGGIRYARQSGFRLPDHYDRWLGMLAPLPDPATANLSDFGHESGKLVYIGELDFLRKRLMGCSVEEFLARPDVEYLAGVGSRHEFDDLYDEEDEDFEEDEPNDMTVKHRLARLAQEVSDLVRQWCFRNGMQPEAHLDAAALLKLVGILESPPPGCSGEITPETRAAVERNTRRLIEQHGGEDQAGIQAALDQIDRAFRDRSPAELITGLLPPVEALLSAKEPVGDF